MLNLKRVWPSVSVNRHTFSFVLFSRLLPKVIISVEYFARTECTLKRSENNMQGGKCKLRQRQNLLTFRRS